MCYLFLCHTVSLIITGFCMGRLQEASRQPVRHQPLAFTSHIRSHIHCSYAILLGPSASVEELGRQASTVASAAVAACDTDASGARTPSLASIEGATPAQRAGWVMSLCGATQAKDALQQLPAGLVLPALALRCTFQLLSKGNVVMFFWYAGT